MIKSIKNLINLVYIIKRLVFYKLFYVNGMYKTSLKLKILFFIISPINFLRPCKNDFGYSLRGFIAEHGPIFIKFGQMLSTRPDFVGESIAKELTKLQDRLDVFSYDQTKKVFNDDFSFDPESYFNFVDRNPTAAASVAQVYKWQLNSRDVAVKVLRPGIRDLYKKDIELLYFVSDLAKSFSFFKNLNPRKLVEIFEKMMKRELDMKIEASVADEVRENSKDVQIIIPKIEWKYVSKNILVMEWIEGIPISDIKKLIELNFDLRSIAKKISIAFFNQAFVDGFFHADLHHGNIIITKLGGVAFIDFGIVSRLSEKDRIMVAEILLCFVNQNYRRITELHIEAKIIPSNVDHDLFTSRCRIIGQSITGLALNEISFAKLLGDLMNMINEFEVVTQPQLFFLQKTMLTLEGIAQSLDPESNMWKLIEPWIKKWAIKNISPEAKIYRYFKKLLKKTLNNVNI
jgi:ubiquinone biosynthesis protein